MSVLEDIVQEYGEAHLEIFIQSYLRRADGAIRAMEIFFSETLLTDSSLLKLPLKLAKDATWRDWPHKLASFKDGPPLLDSIESTVFPLKSSSNPMGHEEDQIGGKIKLLTRQNARAILALRQILANLIEEIVQEYGEAHLEIFIQAYLRRCDSTIRAMEEFFQRGDLSRLAAQAAKLQRWSAALGLNRVYGLSTQILIQSGSNPMNHEPYARSWQTAAALGANRVYSLCTQIMVQSRSNPVNHEQDQIGCKIKLLSRQNTRANQTLGQILASRRVILYAHSSTKFGSIFILSSTCTYLIHWFISCKAQNQSNESNIMTKYKRTVKVDRPAIFPHEGNRSEL
ncbi:hypothetical protein PSTT_10039 [Puccinia striiformis]|uniref:Uncharacterized protein n=1 Tax=Puccinia striiformis TaxID=27350 RepID=A0A2S4V5Z7_9BASI|nr:hypothetical protein PSTT_10039 [Puccinia striiformis]